MLGTFPNTFSQVVTPQGYVPKWQLWNKGRAPRLEQARGRALQLGQTWEVVAWEISHFGSYHLGINPWEVATWEKFFGKVPNIFLSR